MDTVDIFEYLGLVKRVTISNEVGDIIKIDCTVTEDFSYEAEVTEFPIDNGSDITDHVIIKPFKYSLSGIQSDYPDELFSIISSVADMVNKAERKSKTASDVLVEAMEKRETLKITNGLKTLENMILTKINFPRDKKTTYALKFSLDFKQVAFVETAQQVDVPNVSTAKKAAPAADTGKKGAKPPESTKVIEQAEEKSDALVGWEEFSTPASNK
jgi:hypothetical protein